MKLPEGGGSFALFFSNKIWHAGIYWERWLILINSMLSLLPTFSVQPSLVPFPLPYILDFQDRIGQVIALKQKKNGEKQSGSEMRYIVG